MSHQTSAATADLGGLATKPGETCGLDRDAVRRLRRRRVRAAVLVVAAALLAPAAPAGARERDSKTTDPVTLRSRAIAAYNEQNYAAAAGQAAAYLEQARKENRTGREVASVAFILGHARYELHRQSGRPYEGDYALEVVAPLEESLRILQDDPAFKHMLLGNAYHTLWEMTGRSDPESEARAHWYLLKSILIREAEVHALARSDPAYDLYARHLLFYLERCLDLAQESESADLYLQRIRSVARGGFGSAYDDRFWQIFDLTYFDDGNMRAAALWQHGLDAMQDAGTDPDAVLALFRRAADLTRRHADRAEVYRQMADFVSTMDEPERREQAADFARQAYALNPIDAEIRRQLGSALHLLSYAAYASGRFDDALRHAREAVRFQWEGMEAALFDLSRAAAELGHETEALTHGEHAYRMAKESSDGAALQPFAQNYVNILRQFGQEGLAARILGETARLGVR
jgi:hypothetical protein